jgi:hypothetical protein
MDHSEAAQSQAVERYLLGEMTAPESDAFETHFFECAICAEELKVGALLQANGRAVAAELPPVQQSWMDRLQAWLRQPMFVAPVFAALLLAVTVGYQARELARFSQPQAPLAFMLSSGVRGDQGNVVPANHSFTEIRMDLRDNSFAQYRCDIYASSGGLYHSVTNPAPKTGDPLSILVPKGLAPGKYLLRVWGMRDSQVGPEVEHYQFEAVKP